MFQSYYDYVQQVAYNDNLALFGPLTSFCIAFEVADQLALGLPLRAEYQVFLACPVSLRQ